MGTDRGRCSEGGSNPQTICGEGFDPPSVFLVGWRGGEDEEGSPHPVRVRPFASCTVMSAASWNPFEAVDAKEGNEVLQTPFGAVAAETKREADSSDHGKDGYDTARPKGEQSDPTNSETQQERREEEGDGTSPSESSARTLEEDSEEKDHEEQSHEEEVDEPSVPGSPAVSEEEKNNQTDDTIQNVPPVPPRRDTQPQTEAEEDEGGLGVEKTEGDAQRIPSVEQKKVLMDSSSDLAEADKQTYCAHIDVETIWNVADALLEALSRAARNAAEGKPFSSWAGEALELRPKLVEHLETTSTKQKTLNDLEDVLLKFANSNKRLVGKMFGTHGKAERANQLQKISDELGKLSLQDGGWPLAQRMELAKTLIRRYDSVNVAHCNLGFVDEGKLIQHMAECPWRPIECPNKGCGQVHSFKRLEMHDDVCVYKPILCVQGCGKKIARLNMKKHITTVCDRKPVECPFAQYGCSSALVVCTLQPHLKDKTDYHLSLVAVALDEQQLRFEGIDEKLRTQGEKIANQEADHEAHTKLLQQLQKEMKALYHTPKEVSALQKSMKSLASEIKDLRKQMKTNGSKVEAIEKRWRGP